MKNLQKTQRTLTIVFGFVSIALFVFILIVLITLQPKMMAYQNLTKAEDGMITAVGFGLLVISGFFGLCLLFLMQSMKQAEVMKTLHIILLIIGVLSLLFVFSDVALLSDIHKQYRNGLEQPEWWLVYPLLGFQFGFILVFMYLYLSGKLQQKLATIPARKDINIYLVMQYVGLVCGALGLGLTGMGFFFSGGWNLMMHTVITGVILLFPYVLIFIFWVFTKKSEKDKQWLDEKQKQDMGRSAILTLAITSVLMLCLFILNIGGWVGNEKMLWMPLYLFGVIFMISVGNIFYSSRG